MSLLASFLEEIMNDPPSNLAGEQNTPGATYSTRRANSVGLDEGGQEGSTSKQDVTDSTSEAIRLGLAFAESSMDHHSIDGTIRDNVRRFVGLFDAYTKGLDINQVMYKIAPNSAAISEAHKARWAWISLSIEEFNTAVESGEYQKEEFWVYIERHLAATKKAIWGNPRLKSNTQRYERFTQLFVVALSKHNLKYPIRRITRGRISSRPAWQAVIEESIGMGREIYATMEKDTEVDEEEGSN
ncbi:hypothetical protein RhiTH_006746 [Rhizoctonia solani]